MLLRKWYIVVWGLLMLGICGACQKVELPSGEDSEESGLNGGDSDGRPSDEEETPLPPDYVEAFSVADVLSTYDGVDLESDYEAGVVGYIVGSCTGTTIGSASFSAEEASLSNVLIADVRGETNVDKCLPVELKKGTDVRADLNLADHPENMGKRVFVYGLVKSYFRVVGLKSTALYEWIEEDGEQPENPEEPENPDPEQPVPDRNDTIIIDGRPVIIPGGRSV